MARPDPTRLIDVVAPKVLDALKLASEALTLAHVRHVVVGGLAVGANGYPRATRDVDFLVGAEAFHHHPSGLVTMRPEIPFQVNGVAVDLLSPEAHEPFLEATLAAPPGTMMEAAPLVYLKLKSPRRKDHVDVIDVPFNVRVVYGAPAARRADIAYASGNGLNHRTHEQQTEHLAISNDSASNNSAPSISACTRSSLMFSRVAVRRNR